MMVYELDDIEKRALMGAVVDRSGADLSDGRPLTETDQHPGERIQTWFCEDCEREHTGTVLGGLIGDPHVQR